MAMDLSCELDRVRKTTALARVKFLDEWIGEQMCGKGRQVGEKTLADDLEEHKEQVSQLQKMRASLKEKAVVSQKELTEREKQLEDLANQVQGLLIETEGLQQDKEAAQSSLHTLEKHLEKEKEFLAMQDKATQLKLVELRKASDWFSSRMGLEFKKTQGSKMQVIFTCIDRDKPSRPFFFSVKIDDSTGTYIVSDVDPPVKDIDALSKKLNDTNDFRGFIITMRSRFKQLV